ncbi:MAG: acyltransferase, partial [Paludibacteraceae bacterium]|nr:acyltransferase [Paludibacteraceae bacterium]
VELLRFLFAVVIVIHHIAIVTGTETPMPMGAIGVEFFYILTGYFMIKHIKKESNEQPMTMAYAMNYTLKKFIRLAPYIVGGTILMIIAGILCNYRISVVDVVECVFWEVTQLNMVATSDMNLFWTYSNTPYWFLSAMFVTLPLVTYLVGRYSDIFEHYLMWFLPPVLLLYLTKVSGMSTTWGDYHFLYTAVYRAFADILMGCSLYSVVNWINAKTEYHKERFLWRMLCLVVAVALLGFVLYNCCIHLVSTMFLTYVIFIFLALVLSDVCPQVKVRAFVFLGRMALPMYCFHYSVMKLIRYMIDIPETSRVAGLVLVIVLVISLSIYFDKRLSKAKASKA